jgi:glucan phosphoethanolaminetransferase (alkaline phosphatase superfamily)
VTNGVLCFLRNILLWISVPFLFCIYYVFWYGRPWLAVVEHTLFVVIVFSFFQALRIFTVRIFGFLGWVRVFNSVIQGSFVFLLLLYWVVVVILLEVWGRVITEEIIVSYFNQAGYFAELLGYSLGVLSLFCFVAYLVFLLIFFFAAGKGDWEPTWVYLDVRFLSAFFVCLILLFAKFALDWLQSPSKNFEPISLTLYSGKNNRLLGKFDQGLSVPASFNDNEIIASGEYLPSLNKKNKNVILIVVDALRFDHMGSYGYQRKTTPYLSSLVSTGAVSIFANVRASCGESVCGLSSLAASRYSHQMPSSPFSLSKVLLRNDYDVRMILSDNHKNTYGVSDLYGAVTQYYDGGMAEAYMSDDGHVLKALQAVEPWGGKPTMMQFHLMSAHQLGKKYSEFKKYTPAKGYIGKMRGQSDVEHTNSYDNGVLQADSFIEKIISMLAGKGYLNDTILVITADHGDGLGEHGLFNHTNSVREQLLHVPLFLIKYEDGKALPGVQVDSFMAQIDIAPSILFELGIDKPSVWSGQAFQLMMNRGVTYFQMVPSAGLYDHRSTGHLWKYWINYHDNNEYVFDLMSDPGELSNKIGSVDRVLLNSWREKIKAINYDGR